MPRALWITKIFEGLAKALADGIEICRRRIAISKHQTIILIRFEKLLTATLATHHKQAAIGQQIWRRNQLPGPFKQAGVEVLNQSGNQVDAGATAMQRADQPGNPVGSHAQAAQVFRALNLFRDKV